MLIEERVSNKKLIARLDDVSLAKLDKASFKASLRLQIFFTGRTHELMLEYGKQAQAILLKHGNDEGVLDGTHGFRAQSDLLKAWGDTWKMWNDEFVAARREAVSIPFGVMAVRHERLVRPLTEDGGRITEAIDGGVFKPQLTMLLNVAADYFYGDSLNLSDRIWRVERETRDGINKVLMQGIADGDSAWNIAKKLETFLGANEDCPRWTSTRLYGRTASDKAAGDTTGLLSGNACDGRGVSYNALRLARTEIQKAHALATDKVLAAQPWVEMEQCNLSASHPETDECDDVAAGGEKGDGVYPVGTIAYPLHPHCFCYKTAVLTSSTDFSERMNGWLKGESWPEMDSYAEDIGWGSGSGDPAPTLMSNALSLAVWLFGEDLGL